MPLKPAIQTRGRRQVIYHLVWFELYRKKKKKKKKSVWQVSVQVQAVKREARSVMGSVYRMLLSHINSQHHLYIRCRQMKAIS